MLLRLKLRIGALLIIAGGLLAAFGELLNIWNTDPTTGGWFLAMGLVVLGTLVFVYGINMYAQLSDSVNFLGLIGSGLLFLGGWLTIVGSIVVNMVVLPMLLGLAATIATAINAPGAAAQTATNTVSSGINTVTNGAANLFGHGSSNTSIPAVTVPSVNGMDIVNKTLVGLHLPSFGGISQWGHFFFSGGPLTVGCLLLGFALLRTKSFPRTTCILLMAAAGLNLVSQFFALVLPIVTTLTGLLLFATLAWLGASILLPEATGKIVLNLPFLPKIRQAR
ncbi:MAG TPA: hypothetical protein VKR06_28015 [Ktedonosporobacter sp.]|nr:hypothetical protein [Ktedonosporobacter sp.]